MEFQREQVFQQVRDLHNGLRDFESRQKQALENQNAMMKNDSLLIQETHAIAERLNRLKNLEQTRGEPQ